MMPGGVTRLLAARAMLKFAAAVSIASIVAIVASSTVTTVVIGAAAAAPSPSPDDAVTARLEPDRKSVV